MNFHIFLDDDVNNPDKGESYIRFWEDYNSNHKVLQSIDIENVYYNLVAPYFKNHNFLSVVDIGCGMGDYIEFFKNTFKKVSATDISNIAVDNISKNFPKVTVKQNNLSELPFASEEFDCAFMIRTLSAITDIFYMNKLIKETHRIIMQNGYFIIIDFAYDTSCNKYYKIKVGNNKYNYIIPTWTVSKTSFIHFNKDCLLKIMLGFELIFYDDSITIKSTKGNDEKGFMAIFKKK